MKSSKYFSSSIIAIIVFFCSFVVGQHNPQNDPAVVSAVAPVYPSAAVAVGHKGDYHVDVEIDREGKVVSSKAVEVRLKLMQKAVEGAADRWLFAVDPAAEKRRRVRLTFSFRLTPKASSIDSTTVFYPPYRIEVRSNAVAVDTPSYSSKR